jgi:hypothetical protein
MVTELLALAAAWTGGVLVDGSDWLCSAASWEALETIVPFVWGPVSQAALSGKFLAAGGEGSSKW